MIKVEEKHRNNMKHIKTPLVSVCIPAFNHEKFVKDTLKSVVNSTYQNIEIVAIDDGSSDSTYEIISQFLDEHSERFNRVVVKKQENAGISRTVNSLVKQSKGDFIYLLASDDLLPPDALEKLLNEHDRLFKGGPGLLFYDVKTISEQGNTIEESTLTSRHCTYLSTILKDKNFLFSVLAFRWETPFQHHFYSRNFYDLVGGYPENLHIEDLYFALTAAGRSMGQLSTVVGKWYRLRENRGITPGLSSRQYAGIASKIEAMRQMRIFGKFSLSASILFELYSMTFSSRIPNYISHRIVRLQSQMILSRKKKYEK